MTSASKITGAGVGWCVRFAFQSPWPRAAQGGRYRNVSHPYGKSALLLAAMILVGCSAGQHDQAAPEPHRIFTTGQWPAIMNQVGYTNLGVGWTRIHLDGKKAAEILSLLGNPSRRGRDTTELYRHTSAPLAGSAFDQVWQYCGPACDLYLYLSHSNVVYAVYQHVDY